MTLPADVWAAGNVDKSAVRGLIDAGVRLKFADVAALRAADTGQLARAAIAGTMWDADFADTTTADDGETVIVSNDGVRFKRSGVLMRGPHGATIETAMLEEEVAVSGATTDTTIAIPDRAIVLGVSTRTTEAVTGATSYDCGVAGETDKFGATLGIAAGSTNSGVIAPTAYYAATAIRLTANGSDFTGGTVRVVIHYLLCGVPAS